MDHQGKNSVKRFTHFPDEKQSPSYDSEGLQQLADSFMDGILVLSQEGTILYINRAGSGLLKKPESELMGSYFGFPIANEKEVKITLLLPNGESRVVEMRTSPLIWKSENTILTSLRDITEQEQMKKQLQEYASKDGLTGLHNHRTFYKMLEDSIVWCKRKQKPLSLLILDIDHFKSVNDTYGHQVGDDVLKMLSLLLIEQVREIDRVCRYGGEEITIILSETGPHVAMEVAVRICSLIEAHDFYIDDKECIPITVSIGCSIYPRDGSSAEELVQAADRAMYYAKNDGRNQAVRYNE